MGESAENVAVECVRHGDIAFRTATLEDLAAIVRLWRHAHWSQKMLCGPRCVKREFARRAILSDSVEMWLAECDGTPAGVNCIELDRDQWAQDRRLPFFQRALWRFTLKIMEMTIFRGDRERSAEPGAVPAASLPGSVPPDEELWLSYLVISPDVRGRGVASAFVAHLEDCAREKKRSVIRMYVHPRNTVMRKFAEKHGYVDCGPAVEGYRYYAKALNPGCADNG
ncbi:MAG TPA: GNAT family N-acetyltransferase [Candidatus Hydrogenedentes bacterium]|jgi:GNAT superfamily N-acetyltransferase|nr:GNAT family N-acetyltransferase [Candidatus Hydrogenedentota bacterium]